MAELAVSRLGTIVRLGKALPVVFFSSAVDFILPVNCRRSTTAVRAASGTAGKMNSPEAEPRHAAPPAPFFAPFFARSQKKNFSVPSSHPSLGAWVGCFLSFFFYGLPPLGALLTSPTLGVQLMTALQVLHKTPSYKHYT